MTTAIYPGTFDPITRGHVDVVERAAQFFDRLIVAVAVGRHKNPALSLESRVALVRKVLHRIPTVEVEGFDGLNVDFAMQHGASVIVRGLRTADDVRSEMAMAGTNRGMSPGIETVFLPASEDSGYISCTVIREMAAYGADISAYVSPETEQRVRQRYGRRP